ncbi:DNA-binding NarL/FixJ family response regulator [Sphingobium sp. B1D7B]|uniref:response regulator transcription factor n=1 Tax=Sphingobium sp. B1D7B TaxID=2940578 RepID=UPI002224D04D|nr:LuxR C-terminal-related transcriptional regulator [Sphingobium sp. B1D7B]MCW2404603.1 DNA-binding NarL/FixJ family response regulator [Sphingobium sp. B1D7B]
MAKGKSNNVIAKILSVAPGTVDTYLRRVFNKLGVADRTTAAVKGVGMGLIQA